MTSKKKHPVNHTRLSLLRNWVPGVGVEYDEGEGGDEDAEVPSLGLHHQHRAPLPLQQLRHQARRVQRLLHVRQPPGQELAAGPGPPGPSHIM